jgi:signal transduction histidine kinase
MKRMSMRNTVNRLTSWVGLSIQRKLLFWSIGFWVISVSLLSLTIFWFGQTELTHDTRQKNVQLASIVSRDVNSQISAIFSDIRTFSRYLGTTNSDITGQAAAMLALRLSSPQRYRAVYYFDAKGTLLFYLDDSLEALLSLKGAVDITSRPPKQVDKEISDTFNMTGGTATVVSEVRFTGLEGAPVIYLGMPIMLPGGETRVAIYEIDLRDIWQRIDLSTVGRSGFTYAVSRNGTIISYPQPASIGRLIPPEIGPVLLGYEGYTEYNEPSINREVIAAYSPVGGPTGWGIVVIQDKSEAYAAIFRTGIFVIGIWLALAILGTFGILIMIRNFSRPIDQLTRATNKIARTGDLKKTAMVQRIDEVGQLSHSFDKMIERLQESEIRFAHVAAEERNRLARDLHDAVSQTLFSASLIADVLPRLWERNPAEARKRLEEVRQLTRGALAEMRTLLLELRPASLVEADIGTLLRQLGESITGRSRIPVTVSVDGQCTVPTEVKIALYRISQEALNNVAKHSGAKEARVNLVCSPEQVVLKISDDGRGFDIEINSTRSLGLGIIRERAREIGAALSLQSRVGSGTEVSVTWETQNLSSPKFLP